MTWALLTGVIGLSQACGQFSSEEVMGLEMAPSIDVVPGQPSVVAGAMKCDYRRMAISNHRTELRSQALPTMCAVVQNAASTEGNVIQSWNCAAGSGPPFRPVLQFDDCSFQLQSLPINAVMCLDAGSGDGVDLVQRSCDQSIATQRWTFVANADGTHSFRSGDGRCLEMEGSATVSAPLKVTKCNDSSIQHFTLSGLSDSIIDPPATIVSANPPVITIYGNPLKSDEPSAIVGMTATQPYSGWASPKPGGYIEYTMDASVSGAGNYSLQVVYASCLPNAGTEVSINGQSAGFMAFPPTSEDIDSGPDKNLIALETMAFPVKLVNGLNKVRFAVPAAAVPYRIVQLFINYDGAELKHVGDITPVSTRTVTNFDISAVYRLYRFTLDETLGRLAWRYPHNVAHLEYKINVASAGSYAVKLTYSSPSGLDSVDVALNDYQRISTVSTIPIATIPLPSTGAVIGNFLDSKPMIIDLPAGVSRLDFIGHAGLDGSYVHEFAISAISLSPVSP